MDVLLPFAAYWPFYAGFMAFVLVLLAIDLGVFHREAHVVTFRESMAWSIVWITVALAFNYAFVAYQHRVLFYGIIGALLFRALFIALGSVLMQYSTVVLVFGVLLLLTGIKMLFAPDQKVDPDKNPLIRLFRRMMPITPQSVIAS